MKREDLTKLGLAEDLINQIMGLHGTDIESHKTKLNAASTELEGLKAQLIEANKAIESFKSMDIEGVKKSADEWKTKAEQAAAEAQAQMNQLKFDHALDGALNGAKARNAKAVKALLSMDALKLAEDGSIAGLTEQLEKLKSEAEYLFENNTETPKVVVRTANPVNFNNDPLVAAARRAAGLIKE
jgi:predicted  nucleic acid-binding Zn-ribbon protein